MDAFEYIGRLMDKFTNDEKLLELLDITESNKDKTIPLKIRRQLYSTEEFSVKDLDFVSMYFSDAASTENYLVNKGVLRIDIYTKNRVSAIALRRRIVYLVHNTLGHRVMGEGQKESGVKNVYKYRLEFTPLIST